MFWGLASLEVLVIFAKVGKISLVFIGLSHIFKYLIMLETL